ncbi:hypothetical protein KP509_31G020200 [Ceratopteris richardii]|nr:hypothetical protein KP509_31G020200 [Ceratopteris richardii]
MKDACLGTALVRMYVKCGVLVKAHEVFNELAVRDITSWTVLISGYTEHGLGDAALKLFGQMKGEGVSPDAVMYLCILKACSSLKAADKGEEIHVEVSRKGFLENSLVLGTALVDMYAKCGLLGKAQEVFDQLQGRDVACWTALIAGYVQHGYSKHALKYYQKMRDEGVDPNNVTFVCILKSCASLRASEIGQGIHKELKELGLLGKSILLDNALVGMYAKCGAFEKALDVFDKIPKQNIASWTALISGYAEHGLHDRALYYLGKMQNQGFIMDEVLLICVLKMCGNLELLAKGQQLHAEASRLGLLQKHALVANGLVEMYVKCGLLAKALQVLEELSIEDVPSWNVLIMGYIQHDLNDEALECYEIIKRKGLSPNAVTFINILKACGNLGAMKKGEEIHAEVSRRGLLENHTELGNALVDMYVKWGAITKAKKVFLKLPVRDIVSWTTLINGYADCGSLDVASKCLEQMQNDGISPDAATFTCLIKACTMVGAIEKGEQIFKEVQRLGLLGKHIRLNTALVDMYCKFGAISRAQEVFDEFLVRDVVCWTALMSGYVENGLGDEALNCFKKMQEEGIPPDETTFVCALKACSRIPAIREGAEIHCLIHRQALSVKNADIGNALVIMYSKFGALRQAQEIFDDLFSRDVVSWNVLIAGYVENGAEDEALMRLEQMQNEGFVPDATTFFYIFKACGRLGIKERAKRMHKAADRHGLLEKQYDLSIALVNMYSKCGALEEAEEVFNHVPEHNDVLWTALMSGYAQLGDINSVFESFSKMLAEMIEPNVVTFIVLFSACSHSGLVEEGHKYFVSMTSCHSVVPVQEHYACMIDLFSRTGQFEHAICMIGNSPDSDCTLLWSALLGPYQNWVSVEIGKWAFKHLERFGGKHSALYACMRNIYAASGIQGECSSEF